MPAFKIKKRFVDSDRKEYFPNDTVEVENRMKIDRMIYYGIIGNEPISGKVFNFKIAEKKKRGRPKRQKRLERAVTQ